MPKKSDLIVFNAFPDPLAPSEEKRTEEYGLSMFKAIEYEWFYSPEGGTAGYYDRRDEYHRRRLYARGEQPTNLYKDLLTDGEDSYSNFDWRPLPVVPGLVNHIVNQMSERLFDIKAEAVDKFSTDLKNAHKRRLEDLMYARPIIETAQATLGVDLSILAGEGIPESQEEIELFMKLKFKPAAEIAAEEAIKYTLGINDYDEIQKVLLKDQVVLGISAMKHYTDPVKGIIIEDVDPANLVYSYPRKNNFKEVHYYGEVHRMTVNEIQRLSNNKFEKDELRDIAASTRSWARYHNTNENPSYDENDLGGVSTNVLSFTFKTTHRVAYKKKPLPNGGYKMIRKDSDFDVEGDDAPFEVVSKTIDVWYEGHGILGTNKMWGYKLCENMIRPKGSLNKTIPNYIVYSSELYQNRSRSLVQSITPYVDQLQQIHIKFQQLVAKARPAGIYIDVNGLDQISMGEGMDFTPLDALKLYNETGNIVGTSANYDGGYNNGRVPITELKNGIIDGLDRLVSSYNHYMNMIREAIGVPAGVDASTPHQDALVGIQQMLAVNSNTATRHILDALLHMSETLGEAISLRLKDIFKYENLREAYTQAIGAINMDILETLEDYHLHDLGIIIKLKPDAIEKAEMEESIRAALSNGAITVDDAHEIRTLDNTKLGMQLLRVRRARRDRERKEHEMAIVEKQSEGQQRAAEISAQSAMQKIQAEAQAKIAAIQAESQGKLAVIQAEKQAKSELMDQEFQYNMRLKGVEASVIQAAKKYDNDRKDARQTMANSQDSKKIEQRQTKGRAINFESEHDNLSGSVEMGNIGPT
jgi:hypothetical protein